MKKPCRNIRCRNLTEGSYCDNCKHEKKETRPSASSRGYDRKWSNASKNYLRENPLCVHCLAQNKIVLAQCVDHIKAHKGNMTLFWDRKNWQSLCNSCHSKKTVKEDMGRWY